MKDVASASKPDWFAEFADESQAAADELVLRAPPATLLREPEARPRSARSRRAVLAPMILLAGVAVGIPFLTSTMRIGDLPVVGHPALAELAPPPIPSAPFLGAVAEPPAAETSAAGPTSEYEGLNARNRIPETANLGLRSLPISPSTPHEIETAAVQGVLERYRATFGTLSTAGIDEFWPTVDMASLARTFDQLQALRLDFQSCGVELSAGGRATARCTGRATFVPKGGRTERIESRAWSFGLSHVDDRWIIVSVDAR